MSVRDAFFQASVPERLVDVRGGTVLVRGLTTGGKDVLQDEIVGGASWRPAILKATCFDPDTRKPLFNGTDPLDEVPSYLTEPLVNVAVELSAMTQDEVDELEGNSGGTPSGSTASD